MSRVNDYVKRPISRFLEQTCLSRCGFIKIYFYRQLENLYARAAEYLPAAIYLNPIHPFGHGFVAAARVISPDLVRLIMPERIVLHERRMFYSGFCEERGNIMHISIGIGYSRYERSSRKECCRGAGHGFLEFYKIFQDPFV
jgi:hypothetical protein